MDEFEGGREALDFVVAGNDDGQIDVEFSGREQVGHRDFLFLGAFADHNLAVALGRGHLVGLIRLIHHEEEQCLSLSRDMAVPGIESHPAAVSIKATTFFI